MVKNVNTNSGNMKKAVDQFWADKVNAALARQSEKGATITNTDTNKTVTPAPTPAPAVEPAVTPEPAKESAVTRTDYMNSRKTKKLEAETVWETILPESVTGIKQPAPTPVAAAPLDQKAPIVNEDGSVTPIVQNAAWTEAAPAAEAPTTDAKTGEAPAAQLTPTESIAKTADEAFQVLMKGGKLAKSADSAMWERQYKNFQKVNAMSANSLAEMNIRGLIAPSVMDKLAQLNPQKWAEVNKLTDNGIKVDGINQSAERLFNKASGNQIEAVSKSDELMADIQKEIMSSPPSIRDMRKEYLEDNENIKWLKVELANKDADIQEMQDDIDKVYDDLRGQFPTLPKTYIMNMAATSTRNLNNQLNTMIRERNVVFSEYQAEKENADAMLKFDMQVVQEERADRQERISFLTNAFNTAKSDEDWERSKEFEMQKIEQAQKYNDATALKEHTRNLEMLDRGQQFQREESKLQRDQAMEIVKMQMKGAGVDVAYDSDKDGRQFVLWTDKNTQTQKKVYLDEMEGSLTGSGTIKSPNGVSVNYGADENGNNYVDFGITNNTVLPRSECGEVFNDLTGREYPVGDDYDSKAQYIIPWRKPQAWDAFVSNVGVADGKKDNWHIGFVKKVLPDGSIEVTDSNWYKDKKTGKWVVNTRIIKKGDPLYDSITGYFPTQYTMKSGGGSKGKQDLNNLDVQNAIRGVKNFSTGLGKGQEISDDLKQTIMDFWTSSPQVKDKVASLVDIADKSWPGGSQMWFTMVNSIISDIDAYKQQYWEDDSLFGYEGGIQSKIDQLGNALGTKGITPQTEAKIKLEQKILKSMQTYRRAMTGAAASVLETQEYKDLFPSSWFGEDVSMAQLEWFRDMMKMEYETKAKSILSGENAYNAVMGTQSNTPKSFETLNDSKFITSDESEYAKETPSFLQTYWSTINPF